MIGKKHPKLSSIHQQILELLKAAPAGLDIYQIRDGLPDSIKVQQHLDKRVRELRQYYDVPGEHSDGRYIYVYKGERRKPVLDDGSIPSKLRAEILHKAHGKCQMCGKSVEEDGVKLQIDHKIPRNWGGATEPDNLWALCQLCNSGKRDYFSSYNDDVMQRIMKFDSVYERLLETMRIHEGNPTPSWLLEFVANADDYQEDWQKRARELRYPVIGVEFVVTKKKQLNGKVLSYYALTKDAELPDNHKRLIKDYEREVKKMRSSTK